MLPTIDVESEGQAVHVDSFPRPRSLEYLPSPHSVHAADPFIGLKLPAGHDLQAPPSGPV